MSDNPRAILEDILSSERRIQFLEHMLEEIRNEIDLGHYGGAINAIDLALKPNWYKEPVH